VSCWSSRGCRFRWQPEGRGGKWVLITNDDTLSAEEIARLYKGQLVIGRCFRTLETTRLRVRPVYHRAKRRIEAHVKLCVLASGSVHRVLVRDPRRPGGGRLTGGPPRADGREGVFQALAAEG
jgi:hypothetical protein